MVLGLGTGSTANAFITVLAERMKREPLNLTCVATSQQTSRFAEGAGITVSSFDTIADVDLTVDGADEIDSSLNLIKGGGGALLREKIVAMASDRVCIIANQEKLVDQLGKFPLPVEVADFGVGATLAMIETAMFDAQCRGNIAIRRGHDGHPFRTDGGNLIADCAFGAIPDVGLLADVLDIIPGVVEHGLFIGIADIVITAGAGGVKTLEAGRDP